MNKLFALKSTPSAAAQLQHLKENPVLKKQLKAVLKALAYLEQNPRHSSLNTHKYSAITGAKGEDIFEAYAENHTPGAYRLFWHYGAAARTITIVAILSHP